MRYTTLLLVTFLITGRLHSQEFKTYAYKDTLKLDVFTPAGLAEGALLPVMVLFHGGGWVKGTRPVMYPECRYFVKRGFVTVTASYRLLSPGQEDKSICIEDAVSAIQWVKQHARELHVDTTKLVLGGSSAGGHLATMAGLTLPGVKALLLLNPAYRAADPPAVLPFDKVTVTTPPAIQFFGTGDSSWKPGGDRFRAVLDSAGVRNEYWTAEGGAHTFYRAAEWQAETMYRMDVFLVSLGILQGPIPTSPVPALRMK
ncbi:alpha/beta hydrolase [Chitinophaga horti]|uniref:Alpha/beta hydrolase n=1 Tax=Chitinophaga horti TaxID=2920382 RepID=A0ABY6JA23_9BACT|nr:alpha/beta hydrolase [Chitinophaga horti]UYQ95407.1 alpha/beta hydrolase [Chitinophaga horti]